MPKKNPECLNLGDGLQRSQVVRTDFISTGRGVVGGKGLAQCLCEPKRRPEVARQ